MANGEIYGCHFYTLAGEFAIFIAYNDDADYQQAQKYGTGFIKELPDGRFRFYRELSLAKTQGEMLGARYVREWNPQTDAKRDWYETIDHEERIRQIRPSPDVTGGIKIHYMFDAEGRYYGSWNGR